YTITPVLSAIGGYFLYREKITSAQMSGAIIAFVGVTLVIFSPLLDKGESWQLGSLYGNFFITVAALSFTAYSLGSKSLTKKYSPLLLSTISSVISLAVFLTLALVESYQMGKILIPSRMPTILAIFYLSIGATIATLFLFQWTIKKTNAFIANLMSYIQPLTTGLTGALFLKEKITATFLLGAGLVFLGVFIATNLVFLFRRR
ncbi:DMT family transporter, partial [Candidatus Gottesmanbacteria bacterium]|nr:DMT family transporter [Candidatus Gottesmanbacteria bacterium]